MLDDDIKDLKSHIIGRSVVVLGITSWLLLAWVLWPTGAVDTDRLSIRPVALLLFTVSLLVYTIEEPLRLREFLLLGGVLVATIGIIFATDDTRSLLFFIVPITITSALLHQRLAVLMTVLYGLLSLVVLPFFEIFPFYEALVPSLIVIFIGTINSMAIRTLYRLVDLSNRSIEIALLNQNDARDRRAELVKTLKSLDVVQRNLHRTNYALQRAQLRAEEARQLKQQFAQAISHELRTPLNLIIGFTESMIKSPEYYGESLPPNYMRDLSIVYRNATHLQNLVNDVLDLARIEASQMSLQLDAVEMRTFLAEVEKTAVGLSRQHNLAFNLEVDAALPDMLWMDAVRIKQVLYNLLSNAVRFTSAGTVTLRITRQNGKINFEVIDTGIGIAAEHLDSIFEPFRQLENPMRRRIGGAGLGLSISRQLVELHGGRLLVESQPGKGSCFYFGLAIESTLKGQEQIIDERKRVSTSENDYMTLIVTSQPTTAALLSRSITQHRTLVINGIEQLRQAMHQIIPQAIVFDCSGDDTFDLMEIARECKHPTTLIAFSLSTDVELTKQLRVQGYLTKPILRQQLFDTVRLFERDIEHILIIDDERDFVKLVTRMLPAQYRVSTAFSGLEAIASLEQFTPDLILLDLEMPGMDGTEVLQHIRKKPKWCEIPVVIMSAREELEPFTTLTSNLQVMRAPYHSQQEILRWINVLLD